MKFHLAYTLYDGSAQPAARLHLRLLRLAWDLDEFDGRNRLVVLLLSPPTSHTYTAPFLSDTGERFLYHS
jgi:hypothetical protein